MVQIKNEEHQRIIIEGIVCNRYTVVHLHVVLTFN